MRKIKLFIAMSLDGYIADSHGGVDWLHGHGEDSEDIDSYSEFVKEIDTVVMGYHTYHQIITELSPEEWVYRDFKTYVMTHRKLKSVEGIMFTDDNPVSLVKRLSKEYGKDIWICGGAHLVQQLAGEDLIDQYYISVIPTLLGSGIRLFGEVQKEIKLRLVKTQVYNGITDLVYERRLKDKYDFDGNLIEVKTP
ncbi:MAG: dihydrofolate reductase family protein [Lachnospiraceae bacterium]|nr:dihydrofolate reductase family protein [Lachnospiraceae bacterium]